MSITSDDEIREILVDRIDVRRQSVGIVVGVIENNEKRIIPYGNLDVDDPRPLNGDTVFEIGSITKVFTKLLLADMAQRGEVALDDPVSKYLPSTVRMPERNGRTITLIDLATHTSGLPREAGNMNYTDTGNPYADYTIGQLYEFLSNYSLTRDIGSEGEYSNLGFGLLGHALARRADTDYESLVRSRICSPLGMNDTRITFTPDMKARLAAGHDPGLTFVENWDFPALPAFGALRSTVTDLLRFLSAHLDPTSSPLSPAITCAQQKVPRPAGQEGVKLTLGWGSIISNGKEICFHSGGTGGYCSWTGFNPGTHVGVTVLSNTGWLVDDIAMHLLDTDFPLAKPPSEHTEIKVDTSLYDWYLGTYKVGPDFALTVSREGDRLFSKATGMAKYEIFPESEHDFFYKVMDAQITFVIGDDGYANEVILHIDRSDDHLERVD
ncbi:MAG: serine hydrolase [Dehalococcoidales bacterium]|nr:MAG: serine hydrolase [Dehalococcoidales bacterium]